MSKGRVYRGESYRYIDQYSNREVVRLTGYLGHSNHLYFTDPCWLKGDRSFIFTSDRENQSNLFRYDLDTETITQLTDLKGPGRPGGSYSAANGCHYFWWGLDMCELNVETLELRTIYRASPKLPPRETCSPSADGRYVCSLLMEEVKSDKPRISFAYSRFHEFFHAKPHCQIIRVEVATGKMEVIYEDRRYLGHINTSPALPELLTYCHEGPWDLIDQRIWGLNIETGTTWKIRPQEGDVSIGHEYWFADGERIGYHGRPRSGSGRHVYGHLRWDNSDVVEVDFPFHSTHFHSNNDSIIVGDGNAAFSHNAKPFIQLFKWDGERYVGPRILAYHRSTFNDQHAHCHPRFTPDGRHVIYASDLTAYSNIYMVEVGNFDELPELT